MDKPDTAGDKIDSTKILNSSNHVLVVIDTNMLHDDHFLNSSKTLSLVSLGLNEKITVAIPETVLIEHRKHALQKSSEYIKNLLSIERFRDLRGDTMRTLGVRITLDAASSFDPNNGNDPQSFLDRVSFWQRTAVRSLQRGFGFSVPKAGAADLDDIANAAANRYKPFNEKGDGFNDYVIWTTGVRHANDCGADCIVLASQNTADFAEAKGPGWHRIHPDITNRLTGELRDSVYLCTDVAKIQQAILGSQGRY